MMSEVLNRRFKNVSANEEILIPDIIIIDGGRGQFNVVKKILKQKKLNKVHLISVSKGKNRSAGREIIHNDNNDISLKPNDTLLYFIQRIRDEAHRFAITAHRAKRNKSSLSSIFDEIPPVN